MVPVLKNRLPFRLGTSSYVIPDDIIPNVRFLADQVDDVEIVLFESTGFSNIPSEENVRALKELAAQHDLTYTVHLPIDIHTGHTESVKRHQAIDICRRIIARMGPLEPFAYVLHLVGDHRGDSPSDDIPRWQALHRDSVQSLIQEVPPEKLCIENLDYSFDLTADIVHDLGLSICTDIGHLLLCGKDPRAHLNRHFAETRVFHLHGIENGVDHRSVHHLDVDFLHYLLQRISGNSSADRVLTLEIFRMEDFLNSMNWIAGWLDENKRIS